MTDREKRALAGVLACFDADCRTHLNNIQGFAELLADPDARMGSDRRLEYAEIIAASSEALQSLIAEVVNVELAALRR